MAQLTSEERHAVKDCILRALNKLNDKDTQSTGVAELHEIFQVGLLRCFVPAGERTGQCAGAQLMSSRRTPSLATPAEVCRHGYYWLCRARHL